MVKIDSEVIAEVRNALQIIMGNAESVPSSEFVSRHKIMNNSHYIAYLMMDIAKQAKRIDSLLPPVKFEKGK